MFSFLNSAFLFAAFAALIPLVIHLFSKRKVKVIEFSSLRHLKSMQRRQVRRLKIRQLLLLIIRMLILLLVVLAFARPTSRNGAVGSHAAVSAVILFDNSASMNRTVADGNLYALAKNRTTELLNSFGQSDEICLIPLDFTSEERSGFVLGSVATTRERLDRTEVRDGVADVQAGIEAARELLGNAVNLNREIYLVSDRQRRNLPDSSSLDGESVSLYLVDLPLEQPDNLGVVALDLGGQLLRAGHDFTVAATMRNYQDKSRGDALASLFIDGNRVAQTDFRLPPSGESVVSFTRSVASTGFHSGYVELEEDQFLADNRYYFSFYIPDQFSVLIIDGDAATTFISLALEPSPETGRYWSVKIATPEQLTGVRFTDYDAIMLLGAPLISQSYVSRLKSFVRRGKSLFISYGASTDINQFNSDWSQATAVRFDKPIDKQFSSSGYYTIGGIDSDHPVFAVFPHAGERFPEVKFYTLPNLSLRGESRALMNFTGNRPALVETSFGRGRILTFCAPMAPPYTDLVSHSFFVPFVSRIVEYLASDLSSLELQLYAGDNVTRSLSTFASLRVPVALTTPNGSILRLPPEEDQGTLVYKVSPVTQTGIYSAGQNGREIDRFAVNLVREESDLSLIDNEQLATSLGMPDFREIELSDNPATIIAELRVGKELWQIFLWGVVILLIAESLLSRSAPEEE